MGRYWVFSWGCWYLTSHLVQKAQTPSLNTLSFPLCHAVVFVISGAQELHDMPWIIPHVGLRMWNIFSCCNAVHFTVQIERLLLLNCQKWYWCCSCMCVYFSLWLFVNAHTYIMIMTVAERVTMRCLCESVCIYGWTYCMYILHR